MLAVSDGFSLAKPLHPAGSYFVVVQQIPGTSFLQASPDLVKMILMNRQIVFHGLVE
jgi:hypothetical protein